MKINASFKIALLFSFSVSLLPLLVENASNCDQASSSSWHTSLQQYNNENTVTLSSFQNFVILLVSLSFSVSFYLSFMSLSLPLPLYLSLSLYSLWCKVWLDDEVSSCTDYTIKTMSVCLKLSLKRLMLLYLSLKIRRVLNEDIRMEILKNENESDCFTL